MIGTGCGPPARPRPSRVQLFVTCLVEHFRPEAGLAAVRLLERLGLDVHVPRDLTCCGQPAFNGGFWREARAMARHTMAALSRDPAPVVMPSGSCADMIVHGYAELFPDDPAAGPEARTLARQARDLAARTFELSQFLVDVLGVESIPARLPASAAYHPSCHTRRGLGVDRQPRLLLAGVDGLRSVELPDAETCCGFGGLFAVKMAAISGAMLERKLDAIERSGAEIVVGTDLSCLLHIAGGLHRRGSAIRTMHLAEVLAGGDDP